MNKTFNEQQEVQWLRCLGGVGFCGCHCYYVGRWCWNNLNLSLNHASPTKAQSTLLLHPWAPHIPRKKKKKVCSLFFLFLVWDSLLQETNVLGNMFSPPFISSFIRKRGWFNQPLEEGTSPSLTPKIYEYLSLPSKSRQIHISQDQSRPCHSVQ